MLYDELVRLNCLNKRNICGIEGNQVILVKEDADGNRNMEYIKCSEFLAALSNGKLRYYVMNLDRIKKSFEYVYKITGNKTYYYGTAVTSNKSFRFTIDKVGKDGVTYKSGKVETLDSLEYRIRNSQGYITNMSKLEKVLRG